MSAPYILHYAPDNASLIVRLALEELGVAYRTVLVDRRANAQRAPEYLRLNPNGLIPVLETPQGVMFETGAILLWLADRHGAMAPRPDHPERGAFLTWLFFVSNTLHADMRIAFYTHLYAGSRAATSDAVRAMTEARLVTHLGHLDDLAATAPSFLGADSPSVLDFYIACAMRWIALYPAQRDKSWFSRSATPHLLNLLHRLEPRTAVQSAIRAEGLGAHPFTDPVHPTPPEGSAL